MSGEIVNFRLKRKERARAEREAVAEANRLRFGRTKGEREEAERARLKAARHLEGHRREDPSPHKP